MMREIGGSEADIAKLKSMGPEEIVKRVMTQDGLLVDETDIAYYDVVGEAQKGERDWYDTLSDWSKNIMNFSLDNPGYFRRSWVIGGQFQFPYYPWPGKVLIQDGEENFLNTLRYVAANPGFYDSHIRYYNGTGYSALGAPGGSSGYLQTMDQISELLGDAALIGSEERAEYLETLRVAAEKNALVRAQDELGDSKQFGNVPIFFIRLGDIVNAMFDGLNDSLGDMRVFFGNISLVKQGYLPFEFVFGTGTVYRSGDENKIVTEEGESEKLSKEIIYSFNLLDVPITYENFYGWLIDTIISPYRYDYTLGDFLKSGLRQLLELALGDCRKIGFVANPSLSTVGYEGTIPMFDMEKVQDSDNIMAEGRSLGIIKTDTIHISRLNTAIIDRTKGLGWQKKPMRPVYYISGRSNPFYYARKGSFREDINQNIYHFFWGQNNGILIKADFTKQDIQGFREASIARAKAQGVDSSFMLVPAYDLTLECIGNTLFVPQSMIYFHPYVLGNYSEVNKRAGVATVSDKVSVRKYANARLPIEAYYRVSEVSHSVNANGFFTTLKCKFAHFAGNGQKPIVTDLKGFPVF